MARRCRSYVALTVILLGLTWWAWTPVGARVTAQITYLDEHRHRYLLEKQLRKEGLAVSSSREEALIVVSQEDGQEIAQRIRDCADRIDRELRRTQFEAEQQVALEPLREVERTEAILGKMIRQELMIDPEMFGGLESTIEVLNFAEQTARSNLGAILNNLPRYEEVGIGTFIQRWLRTKDLEGEALTDALTELNPPDATWQILRSKLETAPASSSKRDTILSLQQRAALGIKQTNRTKMEMIFRHSSLQPTLMSSRQRQAFERYKEALAAYEKAHQRWMNSPTKFATEWVDLGTPHFIKCQGATIQTIRRFQRFTGIQTSKP